MEGLIEDYAAYFVSHSSSSVLTSQNRPHITRFFLQLLRFFVLNFHTHTDKNCRFSGLFHSGESFDETPEFS